jgi:hypothetical protein
MLEKKIINKYKVAKIFAYWKINRVGENINPKPNTPFQNNCLMHIGRKNNIKCPPWVRLDTNVNSKTFAWLFYIVILKRNVPK